VVKRAFHKPRRRVDRPYLPPQFRGTARPPATLPPIAYFAAAGVLVLVAVLVAGLLIALRHDPNGGSAQTSDIPASGPLPAAYSRASSTAVFAPINKRSSDRRPLTAAEVFRKKTISVTAAGASLKLSASKLDTRCGAAVWGRPLAEGLRRWRCTQVARGMYADKRFAAMVTIFNLANVHGADELVDTVDPGSGNGFPRPLNGGFGQAFSTARGLAMGHYALITWVQRADGTGDEQDTRLLSVLIRLGVSPAVLTRVAGKHPHG
jgi:hypothetical protein